MSERVQRVPCPAHLRRATAKRRPHVPRVRPLWECAVCSTWWKLDVEVCRECDTPRGAGVQLEIGGTHG